VYLISAGKPLSSFDMPCSASPIRGSVAAGCGSVDDPGSVPMTPGADRSARDFLDN
jgi:hypothetical protein